MLLWNINRFLGVTHQEVLGSIVVSISACHAEDPGSIPGRGVLFFPFSTNIFYCQYQFLTFKLSLTILYEFFILSSFLFRRERRELEETVEVQLMNSFSQACCVPWVQTCSLFVRVKVGVALLSNQRNMYQSRGLILPLTMGYVLPTFILFSRPLFSTNTNKLIIMADVLVT